MKKQPITISREEFNNLRAGDLVVWKDKYLRTVTKGGGDDAYPQQRHIGVEFAIRTRSWTNRISTTYIYNDLKRIIRVAGKRNSGIMLPSEWLTLKTLGFDVRKELESELERGVGEAQRMGKPLCKSYPRLHKLITGKEPDG